MAEGIAHGRLLLIQTTHKDFGYDIQAWFDFLSAHKHFRTSPRAKPGKYPDYIDYALNDPEWRAAVGTAEIEKLHQRIREEQLERRRAIEHAEKKWSGAERPCPKCGHIFVSVQDRGQCPKCRFIFYASHPDNEPEWWRDYLR